MEFAPMLCSKGQVAFSDPAFSAAIKWDGWRAVVHVTKSGVSVVSRHGTQLRDWFPNLQQIRGSVDGNAVLDGEIVVLDERGRAQFDSLKRGARVVFIAFDILKRGRRVVIDLPLRDRQSILAQTVTDSQCLLRSREFIGQGIELYEQAVRLNLEGVVLKRLDSVYQCGARSPHWLKVHTPRAKEMIRERMRRARMARG